MSRDTPTVKTAAQSGPAYARWWRCALGCMVLSCLFMLSVTVNVRAAVIHHYLPEVSEKLNEPVPAQGPRGEPIPVPGSLGLIEDGLTVDSGQLYVADGQEGGNAGRIDTFDSQTGIFSGQLGLSGGVPGYLYQSPVVGRSSGEPQLYIGGDRSESGESHGVVEVLGLDGSVKGEWTGTPSARFSGKGGARLAVDDSAVLGDWASGDVYVGDAGAEPSSLLDVFKPLPGGGEEYVTQLTGPQAGPPFHEIRGVAVSPVTGEVYVADSTQAAKGGAVTTLVYIFKPGPLPGEYETLGTLPGPLAGGKFGLAVHLTVDEGNGEVYVTEIVPGTELSAVDEFDVEGVGVGRTTEGAEGEPLEKMTAAAVDPASHDVYLASFAQKSQKYVLEAFGPDLVIPDVQTTAASAVAPEGVRLNGVVNPLGEGEASCRFEWGTTPQLGGVAPCQPAGVVNGNAPVAVNADLSELKPDTTYYFLLQASNKNGFNPGEESQVQSFTTLGPGLGSQSVSDVTAESVSFDASVDPHGRPTTVYFQYGSTEAYGNETVSESLGSGEGDVQIGKTVQGLAADTVYHYRLAAVSEFAPGHTQTFYEDDRTFTTQRGGGELQLPDGRRWELVSPPNLHGAAMEPIIEGIVQAAAGGNAILDWSKVGTEAAVEGQANGVDVLSVRGPGGWVTRDIAIPHSGRVPTPAGQGQEYKFFSEDLSQGVMQPYGSFEPLSPQASEQTAYLRTDFASAEDGVICGERCYRPLVSSSNTPVGTAFGDMEADGKCLPASGGIESAWCGPEFVGASTDGKHIVLSSSTQLTQASTEGLPELYEWSEGSLRLVSVLPAAELNEYGGQAPLVPKLGIDDSNIREAAGAVSVDGSRVLFQAKTTAQGSPHLYLRDMATGKTVRLDLPQGGTASGQDQPSSATSSSDLARVFFVDEAGLTPQGSAGGTDLYEYDLNAPEGSRLRDLTVDKENNGEEAAEVTQVMGAGADGSYVYFAAAGALAPGALPGECKFGVSTSALNCNLYVAHEGAVALVAALSQRDAPDWREAQYRPVRVSPDGRYLAFMSQRSLTGYDNADALSGQPDEEIFLYHAGEGGEAANLVCASCNPTGGRPDGIEYNPGAGGKEEPNRLVDGTNESVWPSAAGIAAQLPPWTAYKVGQSLHQSRYLANSGRLFFDSHDPLVPQDVGGSWGVYEYEPGGVGSCDSAQSTYSVTAGGCQSLISSGTSASASAFLDASETGGDVFFLTSQELLTGDANTTPHIYDARECTGGRACLPVPVAAPPSCGSADACRTVSAPQPAVFGAPASALFSGNGNVIVAGSPPGKAVSSKSKTAAARSQLARALKRCRKMRLGRRGACLQRARRRFGHAAQSGRGSGHAATRRKGASR